MSGVRATTSIPVDPLQPLFGTVAGGQILKVIGRGDSLGFGGAQEIPSNGISIVAE